MTQKTIDLKAEQIRSLNRPCYKYSLASRMFFGAMDLVTGKKITLAKAKLIEVLACIPYRQWEIRQYINLTKQFRNTEKVNHAKKIMQWGRDAQDNEYWHLLVIHEKMKEEGMKDTWYLHPAVAFIFVITYVYLSKLMALFNLNRAFLFNAEFEDHAEHVYAQAVSENPQWESQPLTNELVKQYADVDNWADVFRRIGLDERDHMNESFYYCGKHDRIVQYNGMPDFH